MNTKLKKIVQKLEGKRFTFTTRRGKKYLVEIKGIKGNKVWLKAYKRKRGIGTKSFFGFDFFIPLLLFLFLFSDGFFDGFDGFDGIF
jgi:hypothetical protein